MLEQTTRRQPGAKASPAYNRDRSRLSLALALLLVALVVLVVKDRDFWFGDSDASVAEETTPEWIPNKVFQTPTPAAHRQPHRKRTLLLPRLPPHPQQRFGP